VTLTATATNAASYSFDNGANWQAAKTKVVSPSTTTTYKLKATRTTGACTVTWPTAITITVRPMPEIEFVNPPTVLCTDNETVLTVNDLNNAGSSYCFTYECADCVHNPYLTGNDEAANAVCYWFSECVYGEANTYTVTMPDAGTFTVWAKAITAYGCVDSVATTIVHTLPPAITLASGNTAQTVTPGSAITEIKYTTANATGATPSNLPPGVYGAWASNVYTISGTPTSSGTYNYTVTTTNSNGCTNGTATGNITVIYDPFTSGTWSCGTQIWSGALRNPASCSSTTYLSTTSPPPAQYYDRGAGYGYYYNWTCVQENATTLCPSPWKVPEVSDLNRLVSCLGTSNTLINEWGSTQSFKGNQVNYMTGGTFWSSEQYDDEMAYAFRYGHSTLKNFVCTDAKTVGTYVRCVQDTP
jgi:hypothetical protein